MSDKSAIEWTDATWNPLLGCTKVSKGCDGCYAITNATIRAGNPNEKVAAAYRGLVRNGDWTGKVNLLPDRLDQPLRWRKSRKIFVNSQSDLFHANVPDEFIAQVFAVMIAAPHHIFQVLTKRHGRMRALLNSPAFWRLVSAELGRLWKTSPPAPLTSVPAWIWIGVSVESQATADLRIPALIGTPAAVRWLSCEPLLGPVQLWDPETCDHHRYSCEEIGCWRAVNWVVVGGESGNQARPMHPDWARSLRDQCLVAEVPFLFKQWGEHRPVEVFYGNDFAGGRWYNDPRGGQSAVIIREPGPSGTMRSATTRAMQVGERVKAGVLLDDHTFAVRLGKKEAGRLLDGREWNEYPGVHANA